MADDQPKRTLRINLFWKLLIAMLVATLIPLGLISYTSTDAIDRTGEQAQEVAAEELDNKSIEALRVRSEQAARNIEDLLYTGVQDARALVAMPASEEDYSLFYNLSKRDVLYQVASADGVKNVQQSLPLYREAAYIDATGQEVIRIVDGELVSEDELRDVSDPANTTYKTEEYFAITRELPKGEIYVSPVTAWYVTVPAQPGNAVDKDDSPYKYADYEAVIRFGAPVHTAAGEFQGMVLLTMDHRHIMEAVNHIKSTSGRVVWPDYTSGNYAYLLDYEGWLIAHPDLQFLRGLDEDGEWMPTLMEDTEDEKRPFNMRTSDFKAAANEIANGVLSGESGAIEAFNREGARKVDVYVPIRFSHGVYEQGGLFGGVVLSENLRNVEKAGEISSQIIAEAAETVRRNVIFVTVLGIALLIGMVVLVSRNIVHPIQQLTDQARLMEQGEYQIETLDQLLRRRLEDEVTDLSRVFKQMAEAVKQREIHMKERIRKLEIQIDETKKQEEVKKIVESESFQNLQEKVHALRERRREREARRQALDGD